MSRAACWKDKQKYGFKQYEETGDDEEVGLLRSPRDSELQTRGIK